MSDILQARVPKFLLFVAYNLPLSSSLLWSEGTNCRLGFQSKRPLFFFKLYMGNSLTVLVNITFCHTFSPCSVESGALLQRAP